ncbi:MAG: hypothetical protein JSU96_10340 [Acidobacteriota bacterium]|nr:MAG: hypothetical protein JSU96_10340 [Acidobacteriota bacterium]
MKIDLAELKGQIEGEMSQLEKRIKSLSAELEQLKAVETIAMRMERQDPVDEAIKELKRINGKAEPAEELPQQQASDRAEGENLEWAFQN